MIRNSKQKWDIGQQVKVGFMADLTVIAKIPTPGDYAPDEYILKRGEIFYSFVPHNGLSRLEEYEANEVIRRSEFNELRNETKDNLPANVVQFPKGRIQL